MKIFISVGMHGRSDEDVRNDIRRARDEIRKRFGEDVQTVDNWGSVGPEGAGRLWYLGEAIKQLGECDACYFVEGWRKHKGCVVECEVCAMYGIDIIE